MNSKKAKALRRRARELAKGQPITKNYKSVNNQPHWGLPVYVEEVKDFKSPLKFIPGTTFNADMASLFYKALKKG